MPKPKKQSENVLEQYEIAADDVPAKIDIVRTPKSYTPMYRIEYPMVGTATETILEEVRSRLIEKIALSSVEQLDPRMLKQIESKFKLQAEGMLNSLFPDLAEGEVKALSGHLMHEMLGLGAIEMLMSDDRLEEIVVNNAQEEISVYHKKWGWLATNLSIAEEKKIFEYAQTIGRKVGRQITGLTPLLDAHLMTGDRVNATLYPISTKGNTITIRKFARDPWTVVDFIDPKVNTLSSEVAALLWLCLQYEMNMIVSGGTGSGKTSLLNSLTPFLPANQRIISIEDTRELNLPSFLHWIPLTTRLPNPEGKGEVTMLDLMVNSLRMRPDKILVGEVRRQKEAEVLFEAMHTGHAVYATLHADDALQTYRRITSPPINIAPAMLEALNLIVVQFRQRKMGIRRTYEVAELLPVAEGGADAGVRLNLLYRWKPTKDRIDPDHTSLRLMDDISKHSGMTLAEIKNDLNEKAEVLEWMLKNGIKRIDEVGMVVSRYYGDKDSVVDAVQKKKKPEALDL